MEDIKSYSDLKKILKSLENQGFGYMSDWELHNRKISDLVSKNNTYHIEYKNPELDKKLRNMDSYEEIDQELKKYFSKFNIDDKIYEYTQKFSLNEDSSARTPSWSSPSVREVIDWVNFKKKYNLKDEFGSNNPVSYYNLDKNYLKIRFPQYSTYEFKNFYEKIFGEPCDDFDDKKAGTYQNIGKLEIKFFQKGGANIKGDLKKIKEYYYKYITKKIYWHTIIKYNGEVVIMKDTRED